MQRELFGFLRAYPTFLVLAILVGVVTATQSARRAGADPRRFLRLSLVLTAAGFLGGKLWLMLELGVPLGRVTTFVPYGYRYPGGILAVLAVLAVFGRRLSGGLSFAAIGDILAPSACFAMAVVRVGCLLNGCCFGTVSDLPWAVRFPADSPPWHHHVQLGLIGPDMLASAPIHPLQIYFGAFSVSLGILLLWLQSRKEYAGQVLLLYVVLENGGKALFEAVRDPYVPSLQLGSFAIMLVGLVVLVLLKRSHRSRLNGLGRQGPRSGYAA